MKKTEAVVSRFWTTTRATAPVLALGLLLGACAESEDDSPPAGRYDAIAQAFDQERMALGAPGAALAIVERGEVTFARGFGTKADGSADTVEPTTLFCVASSGKMLTALGVLKSVERGELSLNDRVTRHVPGFRLNRSPGAATAIRVRHLLSHTSGLPDYAELVAPPGEQTEAALEGFFTGRYADIGYSASPPGAVFAYSNVGFDLAGLVAQEASHTPYRTLMHQRVFQPLGMDRTYLLAEDVINDGDYALGTRCTAAPPQCDGTELETVMGPESFRNPWSWPSGGHWSSVLDMAKLGQFLVRGDAGVLREDLRQAMLSRQISTRDFGDIIGYGLGAFLVQGINLQSSPEDERRWYDLPAVTHDGSVPGFASTFYCVPDQQFCFVALANATGANFARSAVVALETLLDFPAPGTMPDVAPQPQRHPLYAGTYVDPFEIGEIRVTTDGGALFVEIPALDLMGVGYERRLTPLSIDNYSLTTDEETRPVTFLTDSDGAYRYLRSRPYLAVRAAP